MTTTHYIVSGIIATSGAAVAASNDIWKLTAFLALGASLGVIWSCLSKERIEPSRITKARILAGAVGGIGLPRLLELFIQWKWEIKMLERADPFLVGMSGFFMSIFSFYIMHTILRGAEREQAAVGGAITETAKKIVESKLGASLPPSQRTQDNEQPTTESSSGRG